MLTAQDLVLDVGRPRLALIPGHDNMTDVNWPRPWLRGAEQFILRDALASVAGDFDIALFDLPPHIQLCAWAGLVAADGVVIPAQPEDYGVQGIAMILNSVERAVEVANPRLKMLGILPTMVSNFSIHTNYLEDLRDAYGADIFEAVIPAATDFKVAVTLRKSIVEYKQSGRAFDATEAVADEMLARIADRCGWQDPSILEAGKGAA
jgi:chromosome partitioning protein